MHVERDQDAGVQGRDDTARQRDAVPNRNPQQSADWTSASIKRSASLHGEVGVWSAETVFVCALALLGRTEQSFPAVQFVDKAPPGVSASAEAYTLTEENRVVLITSSWAFRMARQGQYRCDQIQALQQIAGVLVHEEWHLRHGVDEEGAYEAQLTALSSVGASAVLFDNVRRARKRVVDERKRHPQTGVMARGAG